MDWETWLRKAAERPSDHEDEKRNRTEQQIKAALAAFGPLQGRPYRVYVKGSYANNTNVRLNFDVDIAVEYYGFFYSDLVFDVEGQPKSVVGVIDSDDPYTRAEFKTDILGALHQAFGKNAVTPGRIAYRVREKATTLPADVVPSWEYRRYERIINGVPKYQQGTCVFPKGGSRTHNFPEQQRVNGNMKNTDTSKRYKRMVRALKKLQTRLVEQGVLSEELPSYLIECLVYNVPNSSFGHSTYLSDMREVLASVFNATLTNGDWNDWVEVNDLRYLFRGNKSWTVGGVHRLADAAWDHLGLE
jgi:hypothetical protein